ncbi:threonine/serine exporter family protein [Algoriphagus aestuariicola]|uniref:Threonine/serine exporter family protein n=1 Tax=Algoriphagus aestuariicola TaxID=1852016 RepID=A0ABS3BW55_9BACT|nr:threonine/serine exporter family protein [Algoriphagus aestuariicola]MBN7803116.1 threonine/serine exporter family protein [Algoriphagus aestuariicola]
MELLEVVFKGFWCSLAGFGFGVLFNAPRKSLWMILLVGFLGGLAKFGLMLPQVEGGVILATFAASLLVGFTGVILGNRKKMIPMMITIPSVIPLVPGVFAYRTMLGLMQLATRPDEHYGEIVNQAIYNGAMTLFVLLAISIGVSIPLVIFRLEFLGKTDKVS